MRITVICFMVIALTLTGKEVLRKEPMPENLNAEDAKWILEVQKAKNNQLLLHLEQQIKQYELTRKNMEPTIHK